MFWARLPRDDFRSKLEIISFPSRVKSVSKSFYVSRAFEDLAPNVQVLRLLSLGFDDDLEVFLKTPLRHWAFFCELRLRPRIFFENFLSSCQSRAGVTCLIAMVIPRLRKALW